MKELKIRPIGVIHSPFTRDTHPVGGRQGTRKGWLENKVEGMHTTKDDSRFAENCKKDG